MTDPITRKIDNDYGQYRRLDETTQEIRLMEVRTEGERIVCSLFRTTLTKAPPYQALSYCWGSLDDTLPIDLELHEHSPFDTFSTSERSPPSAVIPSFHITRNLHNALRSFLMDHHVHFLWVDMLCINQGDVPERNNQVSFMRNIYAAAASVRVWLGEPAGSLELLEDSGFPDLIYFFELFAGKQGFVPWKAICDGFMKVLLQKPSDHIPNLAVQHLGVDGTNNYARWVSSLEGIIFHLTLWMHYPLVSEHSEAMHEYCRRILQPSSPVWKLLGVALLFLSEMPTDSMHMEEKRPYFEVLGDLSRTVHAISGSAWFQRVWVLQEVASNQNVQIYLGYGIPAFPLFTWRVLQNLYNNLQRRNIGLERFDVALIWDFYSETRPTIEVLFPLHYNFQELDSMLMDGKVTLSHFKQHQEPDHDHPLFEILYSTCDMEATDPRDRVNAVFQLATDVPPKAPAFRASYTESVKETYTRFTLFAMGVYGFLDLLALAHPFRPRRVSLGLSSWVPDFSDKIYPQGILDKGFLACGQARVARVRGANGILSALGTEVATIHSQLSIRDLKREVADTAVDTNLDLQFPLFVLWTVSAFNYRLFSQHKRKSLKYGSPKYGQQTLLDLKTFCEAVASMGYDTVSDISDSFIHVLEDQGWGALGAATARILWPSMKKSHSMPHRVDLYPVENSFDILYRAGQSFFFTREGKLGICHESVRRGDRVVILDGGTVPYVLRQMPYPENMLLSEQISQGPRYRLVSACYLQDHMYGELFNSPHFHDPLHADPLDPDPLRKGLTSEDFCRGVYRKKVFNIE